MFTQGFTRTNRTPLMPAQRFSLWRKALLISTFALLAAGIGLAADSADPMRYLDDIKTLSAPSMEGRGAGTKGIVRAANMIEQRYRSLGLQPAGTKSYFQPFTVITGAKLKGRQSPGSDRRRCEKGIETESGFCSFQFFVLRRSQRAPSCLPDTARPRPNSATTITRIST